MDQFHQETVGKNSVPSIPLPLLDLKDERKRCACSLTYGAAYVYFWNQGRVYLKVKVGNSPEGILLFGFALETSSVLCNSTEILCVVFRLNEKGLENEADG